MDILGAMESFVSAVRTGSLSGAARHRQMSQPAISQHITALENQFSNRLLVRGRNGVQMTDAGETVYKRAVSMLIERDNLKSELDNMTGDTAGQIVITANHSFSHKIMQEVIAEMAKDRPNLKIILKDDDRILDLAAENIDIALRTSVVGDGQGAVRKIGTVPILHVAKPEYLDAVGRPQTPDELVNLDYIQYKSTDDQIATLLRRGTETIQAPIKIGLTAQVPYLMFQALYGNMGYAKVPEFLVADAVKSGHLELVLPEWKIPKNDLFVVLPQSGHQSPTAITFLQVLMKRLKATKGLKIIAADNQFGLDF